MCSLRYTAIVLTMNNRTAHPCAPCDIPFILNIIAARRASHRKVIRREIAREKVSPGTGREAGLGPATDPSVFKLEVDIEY